MIYPPVSKDAHVPAADVPMVVQALRFYVDELVRHRGWLQDRSGQFLPGADMAVKEIDAEISSYRGLLLRLWEQQK